MHKSEERFAAELLGTDVLVGVTNVDHCGNVVAQQQFHGLVIRASVDEGVTVLDASGEEHWLPLRRDAFEPADPGEYELCSSGQIVVDPTWLTSWKVRPPSHH